MSPPAGGFRQGFATVGASISDVTSLATALKNGTMSVAEFMKLAALPTIRSGRVTLVAPGSGFLISGLTGDTDGDYELYGVARFATAVGGVTMICQPNSDPTAFGEGEFLQGQGGTPFAAAENTLFINDVNTTTPGTIMTFHAWLASKSGEGPRMWSCETYSTEAGGHSTVQTTSYWTETATEFTSLLVAAGVANSLLAGSFVKWRSLGFS